MTKREDDAPPSWPPDTLFPDTSRPSRGESLITSREVLTLATTPPQSRSFDISRAQTDHGTIHFAIDVQSLVKAESQAGVFLQTLTRTFAELSTGLAIFNRDRKLVIFNPALHDLTRLPVDFLSNQPSFSAVLDRLRDLGTLPEPRNYTSWRKHVETLEKQAEDGTYVDTWALPDGQTYRITGHPHPDGALAFLIEDISAEVSITRAFRAEIQTAHAVIDTLQEAIAVFSPTGTMIMTNARYDQDWSFAPEGLETSNITAELRHWQDHSSPSPFWANVELQFTHSARRDAISAPIGGRNGRQYLCRLRPLPSGNIMIGFVLLSQYEDPDDAPYMLEPQHLASSGTG